MFFFLLKNHFPRKVVSNWLRPSQRKQTNLQMKIWIEQNVTECAYGVVKMCHCTIAKLAIIRFWHYYVCMMLLPCKTQNNSHPTVHLYVFQKCALCSQRTRTHWIFVIVFATPLQKSVIRFRVGFGSGTTFIF